MDKLNGNECLLPIDHLDYFVIKFLDMEDVIQIKRVNKHYYNFIKKASCVKNLNYNFNQVKLAILESVVQIEILDGIVIYKKAKTMGGGLACTVKTNKGDVKMKSIKDYIKYKREDLNSGNNESKRAESKVLLPDYKGTNKLRGFYYYSNMSIDK